MSFRHKEDKKKTENKIKEDSITIKGQEKRLRRQKQDMDKLKGTNDSLTESLNKATCELEELNENHNKLQQELQCREATIIQLQEESTRLVI